MIMYNNKTMKSFFSRMSKNSFVQGGFILTVTSIATGFLNYLFNLFVGKALGPEGFGEIAALFAYLIIFSIPIGIIGTVIIQRLGEAKDSFTEANKIHKMLFGLFRQKWYLIILLAILTPFLPKITNLTPIVSYSLPFLLIGGVLGAYYNGALQGLHLFFWYSILAIFGTLIKLIGATLFGIGGLNIVLLFLILSTIIGVTASHYIFIKSVKRDVKGTIASNNNLLKIFKAKQVWLTGAVLAGITLVNNIDIVFAKKLFDAESAGLYSMWTLFAKIIFYILSPLVTMSYIFFSSKKHEIRHQIVFIFSFLLFIIIGVITNLGYGSYGRHAIDYFFGQQYIGIIPFLEWAAYFGTGYTMMVFMNYYYLAKKSKTALIPIVLTPVYILALALYPTNISGVMYVSTIFTYVNVTIFILIFFKNRFLSLFE